MSEASFSFQELREAGTVRKADIEWLTASDGVRLAFRRYTPALSHPRLFCSIMAAPALRGRLSVRGRWPQHSIRHCSLYARHQGTRRLG